MDYSGLKKPEEYGDGLGTGMGRALTPNEVHGNFLWAGNLIANIFKVGDVISSFASSRDGFLLMDGKTIGNSASGAALAGDKYEDLFNLAKDIPGWGNAGTEVFADGDTVYLPDMTAKVLRGALNIELSPGEWDDTNDRIELGYEDLPNGTPVKANQTAGGLTEGTAYFLALDPAGSGSEYFVYDTESHANANDGSTGLVDLATIISNVVLTGSGEFQKDALQGHDFYLFTDDVTGRYTNLDNDGTPAVLGNTIASDYAYNIAGGAVTTAANKGRTNGGMTTDGKSGPPRTSNESRMANVQTNYFIKY